MKHLCILIAIVFLFQGSTTMTSAYADDNIKVFNTKIENDQIMLTFFWFGNLIGRFHYKQDNIDLIRYRVPPRGYLNGLLLSDWTNETKGIKKKIKTGTDYWSQEISDLQKSIDTKVELIPSSTMVKFKVTIKNEDKNEILKDMFFCSTGLVIGGLEKEYNPYAKLVYPSKDNTINSKELMSMWGEYKYNHSMNFMALVDSEAALIFIQSAQKNLKYNTLAVGKQDSHGGRDWGKRVSIGMIFDKFKLKPSETTEFQYEWCLLKGLKGICAYSNGLGADAELESQDLDKNSVTVSIKFTSAGKYTGNIKVVVRLLDKHEKVISSNPVVMPLELTHGKVHKKIVSIPIKEIQNDICKLDVVFYRNDIKIGHSENLLKFNRMDNNYNKEIDEQNKLIQKYIKEVPYLGAEYPHTLKAYAETIFYLNVARKNLSTKRLSRLETDIQNLKDSVKRLKNTAPKEASNPSSGKFRSMADIKTDEHCFAKGSQVFTPGGINMFLWGALYHHLGFELHPDGKFAKLSKEENFLNPEYRKFVAERVACLAKQYGNFLSVYITWSPKDPKHQAYLETVDCVMRELRKENIWISIWPYVEDHSAPGDKYFKPEIKKLYVDAWSYILKKYDSYENLVYYVVPSPEPSIPKNTNPMTIRKWNEFLKAKYGSIDNALNFWKNESSTPETIKKNKEGLLLAPESSSDESYYSPATRDYSEFISAILIDFTEELIKIIRSSGSKRMILAGTSIFGGWPIHPTQYLTKYTSDPRISGTVLDKYVGYWWGSVKSPPEIWWGSYQIQGAKPIMLGEWGAGVGMDIRSAWNKAFYALSQAWGRYFAGIKTFGMIAWDIGGAPWCNLFDRKTEEPLGVTKELIGIKNELIANPIKKNLQVLVVSNRVDVPIWQYTAVTSLLAYFPRVGVDFSLGAMEDLKKWDIKKYKLIICYTEGITEEYISILQKSKQKVLLTGRAALSPTQSSMKFWIKNKLFIKSDIEWHGRGGVYEAPVKFVKAFGKFKESDIVKYAFAQSKCAWVSPKAILNDVEIIAESGGNPVLMKQNNLYWWTDTLALESADLPAKITPAYPEIRDYEKKLLNSIFDECGVDYDNSPVQISLSNDIAYLYDTHSGKLEIVNSGTVKIPSGCFLKYYERFSDGIVLNVSGTRADNKDKLTLRCNAINISSIYVNKLKVGFEKIDNRHVIIPLLSKTNNDIVVKFK